MLVKLFCTTLLLALAAPADANAAAAANAAVEVKPPAIILAPPTAEVQRSCVLHRRGGGMRVLSALATDPAIKVEFREHQPGESFVVTATIPAGYHGPTSGEKVFILVSTNLEPAIVRIPLECTSVSERSRPDWLAKPRSLIGKPFPYFYFDRLDGQGEVEINPGPGVVSAVVFSVDWCEHCDEYMPAIAQVAADYSVRGVQFFWIGAGYGNKEDMQRGAERWGLKGVIGIDNGVRAAQEVGVRAYPVVFLIGQDGLIASVHGRHANTSTNNGLDGVSLKLRSELDLLLSGRTASDFPDWDKLLTAPAKEPKAEPDQAKSLAEQPIIVVEHALHNFGQIRSGEKVEHRFKIANVGAAELKISEIKTNCGCALAGHYPRTLAPGAAGEIPLVLNTTNMSGPFTKAATIFSNDLARPEIKLTLKGEARPYVLLEPSNFHFGSIYGEPSHVKTMTITNQTDSPLSMVLDPGASTGGWTFELRETTPGSRYELTATLNPKGLQPGPVKQRAVLLTNLQAQNRIEVLATASVRNRIEAEPASLIVYAPASQPVYTPAALDSVATRPVRSGHPVTVSRLIRIQNYGEPPVRVIEVIPDNPAIKIAVQPHVPGSTYVLVVSIPQGFRPQPGEVITVKTDDMEMPVLRIPVLTVQPPNHAATQPAGQVLPAAQRPHAAEQIVGKDTRELSLTTLEDKSPSRN